MSQVGTGHVRQGAVGGQQGDRAAGRHQDHQEEQDRDRGRPGQNTQRDPDHVLSSAS